MGKYNPAEIEPKWMAKWEAESDLYKTRDFSEKQKRYFLVEFPYPSGAGLHVGHVWGYTMGDVLARQARMKGDNVLYPMGWDAFGLPAENYAIKTGINPRITTEENIQNFKSQMKRLGFSFDWNREVNTTDPNYYHWTQWIFQKLFKAGLAYKKEMPINWCPFCKTGLAHEEVTADNTHERCGNKVTKKMIKQWLLKITAYADRLIEDLGLVDYSDDIKHQQINWIGRSEGAKIRFGIDGIEDETIEVFTTRPDTLPGATFIVLAPEHPLVEKIATEDQNPAVSDYIAASFQKSELERSQIQKDKTGVFSGSYAVNPLNQERIPIWIGDYVILSYGTGAIMGVPAHDERDEAFARTYNLPIVEVTELGESAMISVVNMLEAQGSGESSVEYKLRDWIFSRQHYWGEPIPIVHCEKCGMVPVPEEDLPILLPELDDFQPTGNGQSPLAKVKDWVQVSCPSCGGKAERETDTMPNWAGSSWYFLRYCDPGNKTAFADSEKIDYYMPVDLYIGGAEHTTLHLLYSRFWHKFLYDQGFVGSPEPYQKRRNRGLILGPDGSKMSKSLGNVINPDDEVSEVGADTLRLYELFIGPFQGTFPWDPQAEKGVYRFLERVYVMTESICQRNVSQTHTKITTKLHQGIKKVDSDLHELKFNTAVAAMMEFINEVDANDSEITKEDWKKFILILAVFAPFIGEELWQRFYVADKNEDLFESVHLQGWPEYDQSLIIETEISIPIQINGKLRDVLTLESKHQLDESEIIEKAKDLTKVNHYLKGAQIIKEIYIPNKMISFVIKPASGNSIKE